MQQALGLQNPADLAEVIAGSDVRVLLCGHFHLQLSACLAEIPVWVTPGVVSRIDLTAKPRTERAVKGASATIVDLDGPDSPMFHVLHSRDPESGKTAYEIDAQELGETIAELGPEPSDI